jgi:hypothetical protein
LGLCIAREDASMTRVEANSAVDRTGRRRMRRWWVAGVVVLFGLVAYAVVPRALDLTRFDPDAMARRATAMWRDYYEKRYVALFRELYEVSRIEYDFSPLDSVRIAFAAATAAKTFQSSTSRAAAEAALPALVDYFRLLSKGASIKVDVEDAARTELAWWQARREAVSPEQYGVIVARGDTDLWCRRRRHAPLRHLAGASHGVSGCERGSHHGGRLGVDRRPAADDLQSPQKGAIVCLLATIPRWYPTRTPYASLHRHGRR